MEKVIIIDGYNIIYGWPELREIARVSLEEARDKLISIMADYAGFTAEKIIIVFDAGMIPDKGSLEKLPPNLEVVFSDYGETADQFIEKLMFKKVWEEGVKVFVATSDQMERSLVFAKGACRLSALELREEVRNAKREGDRLIKNDDEKWLIYSKLDAETLAKLEKIRRRDT